MAAKRPESESTLFKLLNLFTYTDTAFKLLHFQVKRNRGFDQLTPTDAWVEDLPSVTTNAIHRPDNQPRDDEFGLMSRYLAKMSESLFSLAGFFLMLDLK
jgi:hypothetical protein